MLLQPPSLRFSVGASPAAADSSVVVLISSSHLLDVAAIVLAAADRVRPFSGCVRARATAVCLGLAIVVVRPASHREWPVQSQPLSSLQATCGAASSEAGRAWEEAAAVVLRRASSVVAAICLGFGCGFARLVQAESESEVSANDDEALARRHQTDRADPSAHNR